MSKPTIVDEIQVLRFFETGSLEKAEVVFNIVCEKMRERLRDRQSTEAEGPTEKTSPVKKRPVVGQAPPPGQTENTEQPV